MEGNLDQVWEVKKETLGFTAEVLQHVDYILEMIKLERSLKGVANEMY